MTNGGQCKAEGGNIDGIFRFNCESKVGDACLIHLHVVLLVKIL